MSEFLDRVAVGPAGLLIEGDAGIGKTTIWGEVVDRAAAAGYRVLTARASTSEARLTFSVLADLLEGVVDASVMARLPAVQQVALDRVLLRGSEGPDTDERVAAAAFRSVLRQLAQESPVVVAIDDLHWVDTVSRTVIGYCSRRFAGPFGVLATARTGDSDYPETSWLHLSHPQSMQRLLLGPMRLAALHAVIAARLGRSLPRPLIAQIHEISGGNPFYALELARTAAADGADEQLGFPAPLKELVDARLLGIGPQAHRLLLAAACAATPTLADLAQVTRTSILWVLDALETAEQQGIIKVEGNRVRFTHPLLSYGIYTQAGALQRRAMHRNLAALTDSPESRARHLALSATHADDTTLRALDTAAEAAAARGAPSAAAELLELALDLGGEHPVRRLRAAEQHFRSCSFDRADAHLQPLIDASPPGTMRALALLLRGAVYGYGHGDRFAQAVDVLTEGIAGLIDHPGLRVRGLMLLALAVGMTGNMTSSLDYARRAVADADRDGDPTVRSHALALWVQISFIYGMGTDKAALQTALALEDPDSTASATLQPSAVAAINRAWTGDLHHARPQLAALEQRCMDRGNEVDVVWAAKFTTMVELWLGNYPRAAAMAADAVQRARLTGGQLPQIDALTCQAAVAAHCGRHDDARTAAQAAIDAARSNKLAFMVIAPTAILGFLEVSQRNYKAALNILQPLLNTFDPEHGTEIMVGAFVPDAIETLIALGRADDAEPLITALETNGDRFDRPWMQATGARGRAALHFARGDLQAALSAAEQALAHHERLPMPFEQARTQLLLGQVQRRHHKRQAAASTLGEALSTFEALGCPLWAARAHAELARVSAATGDPGVLSPAESCIADLAAAGLSNRAIAAELFLAPKTVEMNLSRVYRKLGIQSRAQLNARLNADEPPAAT